MLPNFSFISSGVAGCGLPGTYDDLEEDLAEAQGAGITAVVSLTERPLDQRTLARAGMGYLHIPIPDFAPPTLVQMDQFVKYVRYQRERGGAVMVHCRAGVGRTGTMLAVWLLTQGYSPNQAIRRVRQSRPGSIETIEQERAVDHFHAYLKEMGFTPEEEASESF